MRTERNTQSKSYLMDMDGVLVRGSQLIPGADAFIERLKSQSRKFMILTNNSSLAPQDLAYRLNTIGIKVTSDHIYTSALATARFLNEQKPKGTAFVVGEAGLTDALHHVGYVITDHKPNYVIVGDTNSYDHRQITLAIRLIHEGARFIATNLDVTGPSETGIVPATGALVALIEKATEHRAYFVGKPNPLMMRSALRAIEEHSDNAVMVGDRMDTDIVAGMESGMETVLVLSGVTRRGDLERFPYSPTRIVDSIKMINLE